MTIGIDFICGSLNVRTESITAVLNRAVAVEKRGGTDVSGGCRNLIASIVLSLAWSDRQTQRKKKKNSA